MYSFIRSIAATSLGEAHDPIAEYIEEGKVIGIQTSGIRGRMGQVVSEGKLKTPAIIRSHGGRPRAIEAGEVHIDIAFVAAPTSDCVGNCRGIGGKSNCGSMGYAMTDAKYADHVVVVTDCLVDFPNMPASVEAIDVDAVVVVDSIGNPKKIASAAARISQNPRDLMMAEDVAKVIASTPYFKEGFSFQTGAGGASLAAAASLKEIMLREHIHGSFALGGITGYLVEMLRAGCFRQLMDVQCFDLDAVASIRDDPRHREISANHYAGPGARGAVVDSLDVVILGATEIDTDFNVNVHTDSNGCLMGGSGGHTDAAAGAKLTMILAPLVRARLPIVTDRVTCISTPGSSIDVLVTQRGIAVNPLRPELAGKLRQAGLPVVDIHDLKARAEAITGVPKRVPRGSQAVAQVLGRDGSLQDTVWNLPEEL